MKLEAGSTSSTTSFKLHPSGIARESRKFFSTPTHRVSAPTGQRSSRNIAWTERKLNTKSRHKSS